MNNSAPILEMQMFKRMEAWNETEIGVLFSSPSVQNSWYHLKNTSKKQIKLCSKLWVQIIITSFQIFQLLHFQLLTYFLINIE